MRSALIHYTCCTHTLVTLHSYTMHSALIHYALCTHELYTHILPLHSNPKALSDGFGSAVNSLMPSVFASASMRIKLGEMPMDMDRDSHRPTRPQPLPIAKATTELYFVSWARYPFAQVCPGGIVPCPHGCLDEHGLPRTQVVSTKITDVIGNKGIARYPFQVLIGQSGRSAFVTAEHSKCLLALGRCSGNAYRHTDGGVLQQLDTDYISYFPVYARTAGAPGGKLKSLLVTADVVDAHRTACTMGFGDANTAEVMVVNRSTSRDRDRDRVFCMQRGQSAGTGHSASEWTMWCGWR